MTRLTTTSLVALLSLSTACAGLDPQVTSLRIDPRLNVGNMGLRNGYELRMAARAESDSAPTTDSGPRERKAVTPVLFWLGIGLAAVGTAGTIGTASAGYATQRQLSGGYGGTLTRSEAETLQNRGAALNQASIAGVVVAVVGAVLALTTFGVDYTRCGPLAPKRRRASAPPGRCADEDSK